MLWLYTRSDLKNITIENESSNMKTLKDKTKAPSTKSLGPELPGMPKSN